MNDHCPVCGHAGSSEARYCSSCGAELAFAEDRPAAAEIRTSEVDAVDDEGPAAQPSAGDGSASEDRADGPRGAFGADDGLFVVRQGPKAGARYALDDDLVTLGRHPQSSIFLDDITVSRRHAEVRRSEASYRVRDVGSLNGTYLNRRRVEEAALADGDEIQIGRFKLVFMHGTGP